MLCAFEITKIVIWGLWGIWVVVLLFAFLSMFGNIHNALKTKLFWYLTTLSASTVLTLAPVGWCWGNRAADLEALWEREVENVPIEELTDTQINQLIEENRTKKPALSLPSQAILSRYLEEGENDFIDARWVQRKAFTTRELRAISADRIRFFFYEPTKARYGEFTNENSVVRWGIPLKSRMCDRCDKRFF